MNSHLRSWMNGCPCRSSRWFAQVARIDAGDGGILHRRRRGLRHHRCGGQLGMVRARLHHLFNLAKQQMLGGSEATLIQHGAVSEAVVREMGAGALANSAAQLALAVSGIAGPEGGTPDKPVGTVWFAWGIKH